MVLYFSSNTIEPDAIIYMGRDKFENEDLIKHGYDQDVWFHVDRFSSAHIYLRLPSQMDWLNIPDSLLEDLAQLTKANSIEGNKRDKITVIYTPWSNLKKTGAMDTGQVSFHKDKLVRRIHVETRINAIINRLEKTRQEKHTDLGQEKIIMQKEERRIKRVEDNRSKESEMQSYLRKQEEKEAKSYKGQMKPSKMKTNLGNNAGFEDEKTNVNTFEDDFM